MLFDLDASREVVRAQAFHGDWCNCDVYAYHFREDFDWSVDAFSWDGDRHLLVSKENCGRVESFDVSCDFVVSHTVITDSSVLCMEQKSPHEFLVGLRNTQVALGDVRTPRPSLSNTWSTTPVVFLKPLSDNKVLARHSSGQLCRLLDLRKFGSQYWPSKERRKERSPAVIREFELDRALSNVAASAGVNDSMTRLCNGIATDPAETVMMTPFVDKNCDPMLSVWSLSSGELLATKSLHPGLHEESDKAPAPQASKGTTIVELCDTITPAYDWKKDMVDFDDDDLEMVAGSFGLWYKLAHSSKTKQLPVEAGNIHHVYFDGRLSLE
jgi:hypothetical protein